MFSKQLQHALGGVGMFVSMVLGLVVSIMPIVAIGGPIWLDVLLIAITTAVPLPLDIPLWIWGLIHLLRTDPTGTFSIIYYIVMGVVLILHVVDFILVVKDK